MDNISDNNKKCDHGPACTRRHERGSALVYILIAIALLAALTITFMEPSSQQTQSQGTFKTVSELQSQADFIISNVQQCVLEYPRGDISIDKTGGGTDPGAHRRYPINPDSAHLPVALQSGDQNVENIRCPGVPAADNWHDASGTLFDNGNDNEHPLIFGGSSGKFLPPSPELFGEWQWYNGTDGVFFWIETDKTDAYLQTALAKIDDVYAECAADVIDSGGATIELTSTATASDPKCNSDASGDDTCLRVWIITESSAVYNGDADGDEAACP